MEKRRVMKTVLTIAGSDCSGGAGIQADLKTIAAHKLYGMSAITSLTAQNTTGVYGIYDVSPGIFKEPVRLHFYGYIPRCGKNRHGIQQRADSGNSRHLKAIPAGQSRIRPGYGVYQRKPADCTGSTGNTCDTAYAACERNYTEYSGGGSALRQEKLKMHRIWKRWQRRFMIKSERIRRCL